MTQPESWWYDEAPSKGAKSSDWKYKFEINVTIQAQLTPL